jgi:hypothetical protein
MPADGGAGASLGNRSQPEKLRVCGVEGGRDQPLKANRFGKVAEHLGVERSSPRRRWRGPGESRKKGRHHGGAMGAQGRAWVGERGRPSRGERVGRVMVLTRAGLGLVGRIGPAGPAGLNPLPNYLVIFL